MTNKVKTVELSENGEELWVDGRQYISTDRAAKIIGGTRRRIYNLNARGDFKNLVKTVSFDGKYFYCPEGLRNYNASRFKEVS